MIDGSSLFSHLHTDDCHFGCKQKIQQKFREKKKHKTLFPRHLIVSFFSKRKRLGFSFLEKAVNEGDDIQCR
jgi:hypothetical protein